MADVAAGKLELWQELSQVNPTQVFIAKLSLTCLESPIRNQIADWLYRRSSECGTCSRTFQLAVSLFDLFHAQHPTSDLESLYTVSAATLMVAVNTVEVAEMTAEDASNLPDIFASPGDIVQMQYLLLATIEWALDVPTACDVVDCLCRSLVNTPARNQWEQWSDLCYLRPSVRFGPFTIALGGYIALGGTAFQITDGRSQVSALLEDVAQQDSPEGKLIVPTISSP